MSDTVEYKGWTIRPRRKPHDSGTVYDIFSPSGVQQEAAERSVEHAKNAIDWLRGEKRQ